MSAYPVHYAIERPAHFSRLQLLMRIIAFCALGLVGLSFGSLFAFAFLALPVFAAARLAATRDPGAYQAEDGPRIVGALRWVAAVSAWTGLISDQLPIRSPSETLRLEVGTTSHPTPASAMWRLLTGLPSALVLAILCWLGLFVWLWAALSILFVQRVGPHAFEYLVGLQRWSIRLLAYQASLVDEYPPFSFADTPPPMLPTARAMP